MVAAKKKPLSKRRTQKPPKGGFTAIVTVLLFFTTVLLLFMLFFSFQYKTENQQLKKLTLLLTPTQSPLLKEYMTDEIFERPNDIPVSTSSAKVQIPIIMYHYVEHVRDQGDLTRRLLAVTPETLDKQLRELKNANYDTYFVRDVPELMSGDITSTKFVILTFDDGYEDFYTNVYPILKRHNMRATNYVIADFIGRKDFMNEKQIREMLDSGLVEIGSHTLDHIPLKTATDAQARREIFESKAKLEQIFGIKVKTFAYPSGSFNLHSVDLVKEAGYTAAVSTIYGTEQTPDNILYLNRVRPGLFEPKP